MKNNHFSDETLQAFLFKEIEDENIAQHLAMCSICQAKLETYQSLVDNIQKMAPETFSFDLTTMVMDNVMAFEKKKQKINELSFWGAFTLIFLIISTFSLSFLPQPLRIFYELPFISNLLIIGTGFVFLLFLLADLFKQYKIKEKKIFENKLQPVL
jgi:hypothetical protein